MGRRNGGGGADGGGGGGGMGGGCGINAQSPATPGMVTPDIAFDIGINMMDSLTLNGQTVRMWTFTNGGGMGGGGMGGGGVPGPTIRVNQGQIVHTRFTTMMMPHTIHHHGIEPSAITRIKKQTG